MPLFAACSVNARISAALAVLEFLIIVCISTIAKSLNGFFMTLLPGDLLANILKCRLTVTDRKICVLYLEGLFKIPAWLSLTKTLIVQASPLLLPES